MRDHLSRSVLYRSAPRRRPCQCLVWWVGRQEYEAILCEWQTWVSYIHHVYPYADVHQVIRGERGQYPL